jgi:hypothetical protein
MQRIGCSVRSRFNGLPSLVLIGSDHAYAAGEGGWLLLSRTVGELDLLDGHEGGGRPPRTDSRLGHVAAEETGSARDPVTLCDRGPFQTSSGEEQREQASCREARHPA